LGLLARSVAGDDFVGPRGHDVPSVFFIARSSNKNQVHYGVRVDEACNVVGAEPVYGYWRMFENRGEIEPILGIEKPAYGLQNAQQIERRVGATAVRVKLRAFPERPLVVIVAKGEHGCAASAAISIAGKDAELHSIYVRLKWPFGVDYVLVRGATKEGQRVEELVRN
jgi:hypothetical protein